MSSKSRMVENICRKLCIVRGQNPDQEIAIESYSENCAFKDSSTALIVVHQPQWQVYIKEVEMYLDINYVIHNLPDE